MALSASCFAQDKYFTRTGDIEFISKADMIEIIGKNDQVISFLNIETEELVFGVMMNAFDFELATAEEHFNESYAETHKFPHSKFKGRMNGISDISFSTPGKYTVTVEGDLTIHGETKRIEEQASLEVKNDEIEGHCAFNITISDYKIHVPRLLKNRVGKTAEIRVNMVYRPYRK